MGTGNSNPTNLVNANGKLLFSATNPDTSFSDLFRSDGTAEGTLGVLPSNELYFVDGLTEVNGDVFFSAERILHGNTTTGVELFKTDGTAVGTKLVKDIVRGDGGSNPLELTNVNGTLFFFRAGNAQGGVELWKSNGTSAGLYK